MKKTLVALATLAVAGGAFAQSPNARANDASGVTIFGVADVAFNQINVDGVVGTLNRLEGSGRNESSRLGFRGVEDLGGGWAAGFWLEAGFTVDDGAGANTTINNTAVGDKIQITTASNAATPNGNSLTGRQGLTFNRASTLSLIGKGVGEIRLGRDYNATFWNMTGFDPFGTVGSGAATNVSLGAMSLNSQITSNPLPSVRTSNAISWLSEDMKGFRAQVQYAFSEVPSGCDNSHLGNVAGTNTTTYCPGQSGDGKTVAFRLRYEQGPINVAVATSKATYGDYNTYAGGNAPIGIATNPFVAATASAAASVGTTAGSSIAPYLGSLTTTNIGGSYTMGQTRLFAQWGKQQLGDTPVNNAAIAAIVPTATAGNTTTTSTDRSFTYNLLGLTHQIGALQLKFSTSTGKRSESNGTKTTYVAGGNTTSSVGDDGGKIVQNAFGVVYDLSKRTAVYGTYSEAKMTAGPNSSGGLRLTIGLTGDKIAAGTSASTTGIDLGISHRF